MTQEAYHTLLDERRSKLCAELQPILQQTQEIVCEIGCGHGHFLTAYAAAHGQCVCLGVDLIGERIARARRKRDRAGLSHLHFLQADGRMLLEALPPSIRILTTFILFPDPWPKLRHHKHRIVQPDFLDTLAARAALDGRLCFRTDYQPYFEDAQTTISSHPRWQLVDELWPFEYETVFQQRAPAFCSLVAAVRPRNPGT